MMSQTFSALSDPALHKVFDLLTDPDVIAGLKHIKDLGSEDRTELIDRNAEIGQQPSQVSSNYSASKTVQETQQRNFQMTILPIKQETTETPQYMTEEAFENMSSPKGKRKGSTPRGTPKKFKSTPRPDDFMLMAEMKRKAIRDCNAALKVVRPTNDPHKVIYNSVRSLNRALVFGPNPPYSFYKIVAKLFPELDKFTDEEKIPKVLVTLSRYICRNIDWAEVSII